MSKKKMAAILLCIVGAVLINILIFTTAKIKTDTKDITIHISMNSETADYFQVFYNADMDFSEEQSITVPASKEKQDLNVEIPSASSFIRIDFGTLEGSSVINEVYLEAQGMRKEIDLNTLSAPVVMSDIDSIGVENAKGLSIISKAGDPYIVFKIDSNILIQGIADKNKRNSLIIDVLLCLFFDILVFALIKRIKIYTDLAKEIIDSRRLIQSLAKNDFRTRFAGSYLGIVWAFIQPLVTVLVYWFVFQVGLRAGRMSNYPFVIFLLTGLVPWFFFSDAWNGGTNALLEYNYLVKKVVFKISILPVVKVLSNMFVHIFFILFAVILCACYGYTPSIYMIQIIYYVFCTFVLVLGLSYLTSAIVGFFRDLSQIIGIILQVGVWMTPIMWDASLTLSPVLHFIFKLNPVYYIVNGYREAFLEKTWFWNDMIWTSYFWIFTLAVFLLGTTVFRKLRVHFADVL